MKRILLFFICAVIFTSIAHAQDFSEKKALVIFSLNFAEWGEPAEGLDGVDVLITEVFTGLGRFDVQRENSQIGFDLVPAFVDKLKEAGGEAFGPGDDLGLEEAGLTTDDFQELSRVPLIVIPSLTYYEAVEADAGNSWEVGIQVSFVIINGKESVELSRFAIDTYGNGDSQVEAALNAAAAISVQLVFELGNIDEFQLHSGILEVMDGGKVVLEFGQDMGVEVGDEFSIIKTGLNVDGEPVQDVTGLIIVTSVKKELSYGLALYNDEPLKSGAQLSKIPKSGVDITPYAHGFFNSTGLAGGTAGLRAMLSRGVWDLRPFVGMEVPILSVTLSGLWPGLPLTFYGGGALMWYIGRLQIEPSVALGASCLIPIHSGESFYLTHVGGTAALTVNWMLMDRLKVFIEGGYSYWYSIAPSTLTSVSGYGGIFGGLGVTFKL